jgi:uncharacterized damage-inducible protein DinB
VSVGLSFEELMDYTDWERGSWREWFAKQGDQALEIKAGQNGDGRFNTIGDLIRHIFSAETRYVDRLSERPLTDTASISSGSADALFQFGAKSRAQLREFAKTRSAQQWDAPFEFKMFTMVIRATPRKILGHVLTHEMRHWAQIATMLRLSGLKGEWHDFLFSPVLGGGVEKLAE